MWPVRLGIAAKALGVPTAKLRRWINEGRFDDVPGLSWTENGFAQERRVTRSWVEVVAGRIKAKPDWKAAEAEGSNDG